MPLVRWLHIGTLFCSKRDGPIGAVCSVREHKSAHQSQRVIPFALVRIAAHSSLHAYYGDDGDVDGGGGGGNVFWCFARGQTLFLRATQAHNTR